MKKLLAIALTLVLALGLVSPAWAAAGPDVLDPTPPMVDGDYDPDLLEDDEYVDPYEQYFVDHPEELDALEPGKLIADWGYKDLTAEEAFMESFGWGDYSPEDLEEEVRFWYVSNRLMVQNDLESAAEYKEQYPEAWATFDADSYFEYEHGDWYYDDNLDEYSPLDKAAYMVRRNILTEEEFVDTMFAQCANYLEWYGYEPNWWLEPVPDPTPFTPKLMLVVNGERTEVEVTAKAGVSYADAADLREIFGPETVPAEKEGLLPIRATAEAVGWDAVWYDGFWYQEVSLWDRARYTQQVNECLGDEAVELWERLLEQSRAALTAEEAVSGKQTVNVKWTEFSTLDGNTDYTFTADLDYVVQNGVVDMTVTFDVSQLLQMVNEETLALGAEENGFTVAQLTQFLKAGVMEFIIDYKTGEMAYNIPLLGLMDQDYVGWQTTDVSEYADLWAAMTEAMESNADGGFDLAGALYSDLLSNSASGGSASAAETFDVVTGIMEVLLGDGRVTKSANGTLRWSLSTQDMNEAITAIVTRDMDEETRSLMSTMKIFKHCDLSYSLDAKGNAEMSLHVRPDLDGITSGMTRALLSGGVDSFFTNALLNSLLSRLDIDFTATGAGNRAGTSKSSMSLHINNTGKLTVETSYTAQPAGKAPRSINDIVK